MNSKWDKPEATVGCDGLCLDRFTFPLSDLNSDAPDGVACLAAR
jgi:hypothetical protein